MPTAEGGAADPVAGRISLLVAAELEQAADRLDFGVIVQDVAPVDLDVLAKAFAESKAVRGERLRVSIVGAADAIARTVARKPALAAALCSDEETAVVWRNKKLRTIAVITDRPLAKAATFGAFRTIDERDLSRRLCAEQRDAAEVSWLRTLWDALERGRTLKIALAGVVRFALALDALSPTERSARAPRHLYLLGLFPDVYLADEKSDQRILRRLQQNKELVGQIRRATDEDWARVRSFVKGLNGVTKTAANKLVRRLREIPQGNSLEGIDFTEALVLWRAKTIGKPRPPDGPIGPGGARRVDLERIVGRKLMREEDPSLADIAEELRQIAQAALDDDGKAGLQDVKQASSPEEVAVVMVDRAVLAVVRSRSTEKDWGGVIEIAADKPSALTEVSAYKSWAPFSVEPILQQLHRFMEEDIVPKGVLELLTRLIALRAILLPHIAELTISPVGVLAGRATLLDAAESYLLTYEQLLRQVHGCYHEMHAAADDEAETVLGLLLCLELYVFRKDGKVEAVMSPLHPLCLWRSVTLVREVRGLATLLSDHEMNTVAEACAEEMQILQVLVLSRHATGVDLPTMLGQAGTLGRLPVFREAPRGQLEADGVKGVAELAQRLAKLRPFVRPGLQVFLVNLPRPGKFIEELVDRLDLENTGADDTFWGIHVRVRYTHPDTRGWANEVSDLDDGLRERLTAGEERGLLSLSVKGDMMDWHSVLAELRESPAHLAVVVDPFEVRSTPVARAHTHSMSPWMPTCEYRFNRIRKEIQVIPVAEEHVFGSYLAAASIVHTSLQRKSPAHLPQVHKVKEILDELAQHSTWTVIADPHRVSLGRLGTAEVIDRRVERGRQLTCFAHDLAPFVRRLDEQLRRTHFLADASTLERLVRDLVAMEPNGILGLATSNHEKQVKGSLGKLIAVRWYRAKQPSGLAVSLDTENASRWLAAGHHSREKSDLLGLREEDGGLVIDVIEVKAHDEDTPYTVKDGQIDGHAVGQVLATLQALAEVFSPESRSPLAKPRREVLRDHLYTALLRDQEPDYVDRWHTLLQDVFDGKVPVRLSGRIVHVQLASVAHKESKVYLSPTGVPVSVDTLSAEDVGLALRNARPTRAEAAPRAREPGVEVSATLEPTALLRALLAPPPAVEPEVVVQPDEDASNVVISHVLDEGSKPPVVRTTTAGVARVPAVPVLEDGGVILDVPLGNERASSTMVHWVPSKQSNGFFLILGASGSGKTETLKVLGTSISAAGIPVLVFDFHGDVVLPDVPSVLLSSGSASTLGLNPMELDVQGAEQSGLYDQRGALRGMIQRAVPALGHRQSNILREALDEAYRRSGIVDGDPGSWGNTPPTFKVVQDILGEWASEDERKSQRAGIEGCLAAVQELFDHPIFQRDRHITVEQMLTSSTRLDLSKLPDQVRFIATETLLKKLFRILRLRGPIPVHPADDRQRFRLFVVIDEAKILSLGGGDRDRTDNILNELITEARKFGLGMVLASQMSDHFSEEVRANAATWLVLKPMDVREAKKNAPNVSVDSEDLIQLSGRGDGYYRDRPSSRARRIQVRPLSG